MGNLFLTQFELTTVLVRSLNRFYDLKSLERMILLLITTYYPNIYPSQSTLATLLGCNRSSVNRALQGLISKGYIYSAPSEKKTKKYVFTEKFFLLIKKDVNKLKLNIEMLKYLKPFKACK